MMIICPACRAVHVQGTLFCEQCGTSLVGVPLRNETRPGGTQFSAAAEAHRGPADPAGPATPSGISVIDLPRSAPPSTAAKSRSADEPPATLPLAAAQERDTGRPAAGSVPTRVRVLVLNTGRLSDWIDEPTIHVGRTDRSANVFPAVDLETDGGHNAGVSRRHARIIRQAAGYSLEDLGSINGTFLNRRRLNPGTPTELKDGDEVRMGNIVLRVVLGGYQHSR